MAKYQITYSCGHVAEKQLFGPEKQRRSYMVWAEREGVCPACGADSKAARIAATEAECGLPELKGSEKQIKWARDIRAAQAAGVAKYIADFAKRIAEGQQDEFDTRVAIIWQRFAERDQARVWIDRRDLSAHALVEQLYKEAVA